MVDVETVYCAIFNELTGEHLYPNNISQYDITKIVPPQFSKLAKKLWEMPDLYTNVQPVVDSQRYTKILSMNPNIKLYIATVASPQIIEKKFQYIRKNFPWIPANCVTIIFDKKLLNVDILVDDNIKQLEGGDYKKILYTTPWNKDYDAKFNGMVRCKNWSEVYNEAIRILKAKQSIWDLTH